MAGFDPDPAALEAARRARRDRRAGRLARRRSRRGRPRRRRGAGRAACDPGARRCSRRSAEACTVTDVGSTKAAVCEAARGSSRFVGGHPVCGSEARGAEHASAELFDGATWFLTPLAETEPDRYRLVHGFVSSLGATPVAVDPQAHDRLVALTSHLPHALANLLVNQAGSTPVDGPRAARRGRRVAARHDPRRGREPADLGRHLPRQRRPLRESLAEHRRRVEQLEAALDSGDAGFLARWIGEAAGNRRRMLADAYPGPGRAAAAPRARARPPGRARRDHAGARRRADQHRGLRAPSRLARARRHAHAARRRRGGGAPRGRPARGAGLRRGRLARAARR